MNMLKIAKEMEKIAMTKTLKQFSDDLFHKVSSFNSDKYIDWKKKKDETIIGVFRVETESRTIDGDWSKTPNRFQESRFEKDLFRYLSQSNLGLKPKDFHWNVMKFDYDSYRDYYDNGMEYTIEIDVKDLYDSYLENLK